VATRIVTLSAPFGAGGSVIGPAVAERLGIPFVDRAIPAAVAHDLAVSVDQALAHDQQLPGAWTRALTKMANTIPPFGAASLGAVADVEGDELFKAGTERVLREVAAQTGGVILGRAAAIVLAHHPGALHARLQGSRDGRLARTMANMSLSRDDASRLLDESDRSRVAYVKHFYRVDPRDPSLYHLLLDTTVIPDETCIDLITSAALARDPAREPER
jgi:cytidylate kinase